MISPREEARPDFIKDIFKEPWLKDNNFTNEDYIEYENAMKDLENKLNEDNETMENKNNNGDDNNMNLGSGFRGTEDKGKIFFNYDLRPKYKDIIFISIIIFDKSL